MPAVVLHCAGSSPALGTIRQSKLLLNNDKLAVGDYVKIIR